MKYLKRICLLLVCGLFFIGMNQTTQTKAAIKLNKTKVTVRLKRTPYKLKIKGTNKKVTWSSSKKSVATVSRYGKIKPKKKGSATITAKVNGHKYKCKVTVVGKNDYNKTLTEKIIRKKLHIPTEATAKFVFYKKTYWQGANQYVLPVRVRGTGKYKQYMAGADFTLKGELARNIAIWDKYN